MSCPAGFTDGPECPWASASQKPFNLKPSTSSFLSSTAKESLKPGDPLHLWGVDSVWTNDHCHPSQLEPLRILGDDLGDEALLALGVRPGQDLLQVWRDYISRPEGEQENDAPRKLMEKVLAVPEWVDWEQVKRGQAVHWRYSYYMMTILLYCSLAGGMAVTRINKVLTATGYMTGSKTLVRLYETAVFLNAIFNSIENLQPGTGLGWESILRVRFLHSGVRTRLLKSHQSGRSRIYDVEENGVPINQEDLVGTVFSFTSIVWKALEYRLGVVMTREEREDHLHLWRYVGYMMGVDDILDLTSSSVKAEAGLDSVIVHLCHPDPSTGRLSSNILECFAGPASSATLPAAPTSAPAYQSSTKALSGMDSDPSPTNTGSKAWLPNFVCQLNQAMMLRLLGTEFLEMSAIPIPSGFPARVSDFVYTLYGMDLWMINHLVLYGHVRAWVNRKACVLLFTTETRNGHSRFNLKVGPKEVVGTVRNTIQDRRSQQGQKKRMVKKSVLGKEQFLGVDDSAMWWVFVWGLVAAGVMIMIRAMGMVLLEGTK